MAVWLVRLGLGWPWMVLPVLVVAWVALSEVHWAAVWQGVLLARRTGRTRVRRGESLGVYVSQGNVSTESYGDYAARLLHGTTHALLREGLGAVCVLRPVRVPSS